MRKEEAFKTLEENLCAMCAYGSQNMNSCDIRGCDNRDAIEALKQEPVLDKIRAEIWDLQYGDEEKSMTDEDRADAYNNAITQVIDIIDKHKAESEEEDNGRGES